MGIKAIRSRSQYDLVLDPDAIWSCTQMSFGPGHIRDPGPGQEATQSWTQMDKFIYPGLPPMKPHFHFTTAYKMSQFKHKQFYATQASDRHLPYFSHNIEASHSHLPQFPSQNHLRQQDPCNSPKKLFNKSLPTSHSIKFRISIHVQFEPRFPTLLIQQGRATTPFQRAGLIPQFSK